MGLAVELEGNFCPRLRKWLHILLLGFKSHINHAGNLQKLIELGYDCKHFFVLAIEVLLVAIRANNKILLYRFHYNCRQGAKPQPQSLKLTLTI